MTTKEETTDLLLDFDKIGCSCKLPANNLYRLLQMSGLQGLISERRFSKINDSHGIIQTIDFFTPVTTNPFYQGKITANNVLNDLFAMGISKINCFSIILGLKQDTKLETAAQIIEGIKQVCSEVKTTIVGGHTAQFCDVIVGGSAVAIADRKKLIFPRGAEEGDILLLTKPLGAQLVMLAAYRQYCGLLQDNTVSNQLQDRAIQQMSSPSNKIAKVISSLEVHAATDITGFGILEHAAQIAKNSKVDILIENLPILKGTINLAELLGKRFDGTLPETAGGILLCLPSSSIEEICDRLNKQRETAFIVGRVMRKANKIGKATISQNLQLTEV